MPCGLFFVMDRDQNLAVNARHPASESRAGVAALDRFFGIAHRLAVGALAGLGEAPAKVRIRVGWGKPDGGVKVADSGSMRLVRQIRPAAKPEQTRPIRRLDRVQRAGEVADRAGKVFQFGPCDSPQFE